VLGQWISAKMYLGYRRGGLLECLREEEEEEEGRVVELGN